MSTSNLPAPSLRPLTLAADDSGVLAAVDPGAACCGGDSCCAFPG